MAFSYNSIGTSTPDGINVNLYPDGTSSSVTFNVTEQPFNLPFSAGNGPTSVTGPTSFSFTGNISGTSKTFEYDMAFSYNPTTFEVTITFTVASGFSYEPIAIPNTEVFNVAILFLYTSL